MPSRNHSAAVGPIGLAETRVWREFLLLSKPGITRLVTIASGVGFAMAVAWHGTDPGSLVLAAIACIIGTASASAGANALNQIMEVDRDRLMARTANRPLPSGRLNRRAAWAFALTCAVAGPVILAAFAHPVAGVLAALTIVLYVLVYTPSKPRTPLSTFIGAVPGAMPCLIGWAAASPEPLADLGRWPTWSVFSILLVWQIPHFLAIAMMYRDQYEGAGFRPVPRAATSKSIAVWIAAWTVATVLVSLSPLVAMPGRVGWLYGIVALCTGGMFLAPSFQLVRDATPAAARRVFLTSIAYLPLAYIALVADGLFWNAPR